MILKKNKFKFSIVILVLIFIFIRVHTFHSGYNYPMHLDEYHHIAQSVQIIEKKGFVSINPYFAEPIRHEDLEPGNVYSLAKGIINFLEDEKLRRGCERKARKRAEKEYKWGVTANNLLGAYKIA